jgi:hypothetical protein
VGERLTAASSGRERPAQEEAGRKAVGIPLHEPLGVAELGLVVTGEMLGA